VQPVVQDQLEPKVSQEPQEYQEFQVSQDIEDELELRVHKVTQELQVLMELMERQDPPVHREFVDHRVQEEKLVQRVETVKMVYPD
jgi:hypothetical protein